MDIGTGKGQTELLISFILSTGWRGTHYFTDSF